MTSKHVRKQLFCTTICALLHYNVIKTVWHVSQKSKMQSLVVGIYLSSHTSLSYSGWDILIAKLQLMPHYTALLLLGNTCVRPSQSVKRFGFLINVSNIWLMGRSFDLINERSDPSHELKPVRRYHTSFCLYYLRFNTGNIPNFYNSTFWQRKDHNKWRYDFCQLKENHWVRDIHWQPSMYVCSWTLLKWNLNLNHPTWLLPLNYLVWNYKVTILNEPTIPFN